jgi:hypothetical protein
MESDEYTGIANLEFTEQARERFCQALELLVSVRQFFCKYRKQSDRIF